MTIVKLVAYKDDLLFHCAACAPEGKDYELFDEPTNSNQPEMFCNGCHIFLGFDHAIQPEDKSYWKQYSSIQVGNQELFINTGNGAWALFVDGVYVKEGSEHLISPELKEMYEEFDAD